MTFDDPRLRTLARQRIEVLRRLTEDLAGIVDGSRPTEADLLAAVPMRGFLLAERSVPCLAGTVEGHPTLGSRLITTSQIFAADPKARWVRTMSRFYRLEPGDEAK